eukprot:9117515-Alexandrium_andersonii.AAC.1
MPSSKIAGQEKQPAAPFVPQPGTKAASLQQALEANSFNLQGVVGKYWNQAKRSDPELASAYQALGRSYQSQRDFRMRWARGEYEKCIASKTHVEST